MQGATRAAGLVPAPAAIRAVVCRAGRAAPAAAALVVTQRTHVECALSPMGHLYRRHLGALLIRHLGRLDGVILRVRK
ncbi:hypothetical protein MAH_0761 [Mycobacterium avium subsp. hominissuis TH135]|nr:hypothetical protein MAH_0761 [Mycobacterium avium subsp. hominissuis TH135]